MLPDSVKVSPLLRLSTLAPCHLLTRLDIASFQSKLTPFFSAGFSLRARHGSPSNFLEPSLIIITRTAHIVNEYFYNFLFSKEGFAA